MPIDSLSVEPSGKTVTKQLLSRSCIVVFAVLSVIVVISFLPHAQKSPVRNAESPRNTEDCTGNAMLRHVHILHRHGERTPIHWFNFEGDWGWQNESLAPGKLTSRGMEHAFQLGQALKRKYGSSVDFASKQRVSVYSTDYDRTVDTVRSLLLGIYSDPGTRTRVQNVCPCRKDNGARSSAECIAICIGIGSETIPAIPDVHVRGQSDPAFHQANVCKGWAQWLDELEASDVWRHAADDEFSCAEHQIVALAASDKIKVLGWPDGNCEACAHIHDPDVDLVELMEQIWSNLECYDADNKTYSVEAANSDILRKLQPAANYAWQTKYASAKGNLTGGMLLDEMIEELQNVSTTDQQCQEAAKENDCEGDGASVTIYSAHDTTVYSILAALGAAEELPIPHFTSHFRMELWEWKTCASRQRFEVRLYYDSETGGANIDHVLTESPACPGGSCTLHNFYNQTRTRAIAAADCASQESSTVTAALPRGCCEISHMDV